MVQLIMNSRRLIVFFVLLMVFIASISHAADKCQYYFLHMEYDSAITECTRAINSKDENSDKLYEYYATRGLMYKIRGQYDEALSDFNSAVNLGTDNKAKLAFAYNDRGTLYQQKRLYALAISDYNKAIELNPDSYTGMYNLAGLYSLINKADSACKWMKKSIESGFSVWKQAFSREKDLDNIRNSSCYKKIMQGS